MRAHIDHCAEYSFKNLRYGFEEGEEIRISRLDLCSILGVEADGPETLDLAAAVLVAEHHDPDLAASLDDENACVFVWLKDRFLRGDC